MNPNRAIIMVLQLYVSYHVLGVPSAYWYKYYINGFKNVLCEIIQTHVLQLN
jgi:hypothetical protein